MAPVSPYCPSGGVPCGENAEIAMLQKMHSKTEIETDREGVGERGHRRKNNIKVIRIAHARGQAHATGY